MDGVQISITTDCCSQQPWVWTLVPQGRSVEIHISDLGSEQPSMWPGSLLAGLGTPWNTLELQASLALSTQQLILHWSSDQWQLEGKAQLDVVHASTSLSNLKPMGSYRLDFTGGNQPALLLSTLAGSLQLSGRGKWAAGRLQFEGEASAAPDRAEALSNLLNIIGRRIGSRYVIQVR
jgi:general secretion pathway protein N